MTPLDDIFEELARLQQRDECADLLQFRSLVTAHQYVGLVGLVREFVPRSAKVLDWGCGNGHFSYTLEKLGYEVEGFSFEDFGLRSYLSPDYRLTLGSETDPSTLPYPDGSFDAATSVGVLEHVRETGGREEASLREIHRILKVGGRFVCYHFPNRYSWIETLNGVIPGAHHHRYRYTASDIRRLCDSAGLRCLKVRRYGALPRNMWHRAPTGLRGSRIAAAAWDGADSLLGLPLTAVCQNYAFVAEKPRDPPRRRKSEGERQGKVAAREQ